MTDQRLSDQGAQAQAASEAPAAGAAQSAPFPPPSGWMPAPQAAAPAAYPLPTRPAPRTTQRRDLLAAALVLLFCFLYWDSLFWAEKLGVGEAVSLAGLLLTAVWYQRKAGRQITALIPLRCAASATPCAWLPAEQAMTPFSFSASES